MLNWRFGWTLMALALSATMSLAAEPISSRDWPQWRGPNRENKSPQTGLLKNWDATPPRLEWKLNGMGAGYASVSIVGDRLYTTGNMEQGQHVVAVDLKTHAVAWKQPLTDVAPKHGYEGSRCTPTVDGDRLYVVSSDGQIVCLQASDGKIVWRKRFDQEWGGKMMSGWGFSESPLVDGDRVICTPGADDAMVVALDKQTGKEIWRSKMTDQGRGGAGYSSVVISEGAGVKQYVTLVGRGVISVRASDGKHLWTYGKIANGTANIPTPVPVGDYVFASSGYGEGGSCLLKLVRGGDGVSAVEVWHTNAKQLQNHHGGMVVDGDYAYFGHGHNNGFPVCVELATGKIVWGGSQRGPGAGSAAITFADGHLIFRYQSGEVALIEATPKEYRLKGVFKPEVVVREAWAHPVVCRGKLYLREQDTLMCYDVVEGKR
jgi:outer membrane protein assembly factor BamB